MKRSTVNYIGFGLLVAAALSYLAAIWVSETTSEHFGLTGVLLMFCGGIALGTASFMSNDPAPGTADRDDY